jgi:hypothetical protein
MCDLLGVGIIGIKWDVNGYLLVFVLGSIKILFLWEDGKRMEKGQLAELIMTRK